MADALIEELDPPRSGPRAERLHVVPDFQQVAALRTAVDDFKQAVLTRATVDTLEPSVIAHGKNFLPGTRYVCRYSLVCRK